MKSYHGGYMKKIVGFIIIASSLILLVSCSTEKKEEKRETSISQSSSDDKKKLEIICFDKFETNELGKAIISGTTEPNATVSVDKIEQKADEHGLFRLEFQLTELSKKELILTSKIRKEKVDKKITVEPSMSYLRSKEESSTSSSLPVAAEPQASSESTEQITATPSTPTEEPRNEDTGGQVLVSPNGEALTVQRVLPNGEHVISEQTSQADLNNDGILTYEELSQAENDLNKQTEEVRRRQLEDQNRQ